MKKKRLHKPCYMNFECLLNLPHSVCCSEKYYFLFFKYAECVVISWFNTLLSIIIISLIKTENNYFRNYIATFLLTTLYYTIFQSHLILHVKYGAKALTLNEDTTTER